MLTDNFVTMEIGKAKHIALVAHDGKKKELIEWCDRNKEFPLRNRNNSPSDRRENRTSGKRILQWSTWWRPADRCEDRRRTDRFHDLPVGSVRGTATRPGC